jgi:hypothetical protein
VAPHVSLGEALARVCNELAALRVPFALVGGLAVSARAEPRLTRDVDLAIAVTDDEMAERQISMLVSRGYAVTATVEQTKTARLATVRLAAPGATALVVDLLFASCGIEAEIVAAAEPLEILPGLVIPVARAGHLIAMKLLARDDRERPQDLDDIRALVGIATSADRRLVTKAIGLISKRGFARGRDLAAAWRAVSTRRRS